VKHTVSASQIADWRLCRRKLLWKQVVGLRPPQTKAAEFGSLVHKLLECQLSGQILSKEIAEKWASREVLDADTRMREALQYFVPLGGLPEHEFRFSWGGVEWAGRIDYLANNIVFDLKTTSSSKWVKTETELSCDPQAIIYAAASGATSARWVYSITRGAPSAIVRDFVPIRSGPVVDLLLQDGNDVTWAVEDKTHPLSIPPPEDLGACSAYGGCPFRENCTDIIPTSRLRKVNAMTSMAEIRAKLAQSIQSNAASSEPKKAAIIDVNPPEQAEAGPPPLPPVNEPKKSKSKAKQVDNGQKELPVQQNGGESRDTSLTGEKNEVINPSSQSTPSSKPDHTNPGQAEPGGNSSTPTAESDDWFIDVLFIGCIITGPPQNHVVDLADVMQEAHRQLREQLHIDHYLFEEYSKGKGVLCAIAMKLLAQIFAEKRKKGPGFPMFVSCDPMLPETGVILNELLARAVSKVRAVR
jgi:hypothetical protein